MPAPMIATSLKTGCHGGVCMVLRERAAMVSLNDGGGFSHAKPWCAETTSTGDIPRARATTLRMRRLLPFLGGTFRPCKRFDAVSGTIHARSHVKEHTARAETVGQG